MDTTPRFSTHAIRRLAGRFSVAAEVGAPADLESSVVTVSGNLQEMRGWAVRGVPGSLAVLSDDDATVVTVMVERPVTSIRDGRGQWYLATRSELPRDLASALAVIRGAEEAAVALGHRLWTLEGAELVSRFGWARGDHSQADFGCAIAGHPDVLRGGSLMYAHRALERAEDHVRALIQRARTTDRDPSLAQIEGVLRAHGALRSDLVKALAAAHEGRRRFGPSAAELGAGAGPRP